MEFNLQKFVDGVINRDDSVSLDKLGMAANSGEISHKNRPLKWQRYQPGVSDVPSQMQYELDVKISEFRSQFAPFVYGAKTPNAQRLLDSMKIGDGGVVFCFYTKDEAVSQDDFVRLGKEKDPILGNTPKDRQMAKARLINVAKFFMNNGVKIFPAATSENPSDSDYENLSDKHLSHFGYAFRGMSGVKVKEGESSKPAKVLSFNLSRWQKMLSKSPNTGVDDVWECADLAMKTEPDVFGGKLAEIQILPTESKGFGAFFVFREKDGEGNWVVKGKRGLANNTDDTQTLESFFKGSIRPFNDVLWIKDINDPNTPIKLTAGRTSKLKSFIDQRDKHGDNILELFQEEEYQDNPEFFNELNGLKGETENETNRLRDAFLRKRYRTVAGIKGEQNVIDDKNQVARPSRLHQLWMLKFHPDETLYVENVADPKKVVNLQKHQIEGLINWGQNYNGKYESPNDPNFRKRLWAVYAAAKKVDSFSGKEKPSSYGKWDVDPDGKDKLRKEWKPVIELLVKLLDRYHSDRLAAGEKLPKQRHTAGQYYLWNLVIPKYENPQIIDQMSGKSTATGRRYNPNNDVFYNPDPQNVHAEANILMEKLAQSYHVGPFKAIRDWAVITHDLNEKKFELSGGARGMHENISGKKDEAYKDVGVALKTLFSKQNIDSSLMPSAKEQEFAQMAFELAGKEIDEKQIPPNDSNEAAQQEKAKRDAAVQLEKQKQQQNPITSLFGVEGDAPVPLQSVTTEKPLAPEQETPVPPVVTAPAVAPQSVEPPVSDKPVAPAPITPPKKKKKVEDHGQLALFGSNEVNKKIVKFADLGDELVYDLLRKLSQ